ncbi:hypothetical protein ACFYZ4_25645 [Streptomyces sp. NPDC001513]|uniref:hypothetical protein n=1 Tax=Streptomyces sp. NPDC001513 TaxID=3364580 RepID=UPI00368652CD
MSWFADLDENYQADHPMLRHHRAYTAALAEALAAVQGEDYQRRVAQRATDDIKRAGPSPSGRLR